MIFCAMVFLGYACLTPAPSPVSVFIGWTFLVPMAVFVLAARVPRLLLTLAAFLLRHRCYGLAETALTEADRQLIGWNHFLSQAEPNKISWINNERVNVWTQLGACYACENRRDAQLAAALNRFEIHCSSNQPLEAGFVAEELADLFREQHKREKAEHWAKQGILLLESSHIDPYHYRSKVRRGQALFHLHTLLSQFATGALRHADGDRHRAAAYNALAMTHPD